jgi:maltose O-acetyltransferase
MKSEKQKMLSGELYLASDSELLSERAYASRLLFEIHSLPPGDPHKQLLLKQLLGSTGDSFVIERGFHCDYGYNIHVGENFYANVNCTILDCAEVRFGKNVLLAPNVGIYTAGHPLDTAQRIAGQEFAHPITIGDNVWLGANVVVLPNVTIGANTVIGAGSVVTKDIPANVLAYGNPCRVVKSLAAES